MWHPAVNDVHRFDAALRGFERSADFREHTATDGAVCKQGVDLSQDPELHKMLKPISEEEIEKHLEREIL